MKTSLNRNEILSVDDSFLILIDENGIIIDTNELFSKTFFYSSSIKEGHNIYEILHGESKHAFQSAVNKTLAGTNPYIESLMLQNGVLHHQVWKIKKLTINEVGYFLCLGKPLGENIFNIKELNKLKEEFNSLKTGIIFHDGKHIINANQDAADILECKLDSVIKNKYLTNLLKVQKENKNSQSADLRRAFISNWMQEKNGISKVLKFQHFGFRSENAVIQNQYITCFYELQNKDSMVELKNTEITESVFADFFTKSGSIKWIVDETGKLLFANKCFLKFFKLNQDVINRNLKDIFPNNLMNLFQNAHNYVLENGDIQNHIQHSRQADGKDFYLLTNLHYIDSMAPLRLIGGEAIDITDSTKAKKELNRAAERLQIMTKFTTDAIWEWNIKTGEIFRNESLHKLIGYQAYETSNLSWWYDKIHPDDREKVEQKISYILSHQIQSWEQEYRFKCMNGSYMQVFDRGYVIYEYDVPVKMIGTIQDLSRIKALEESLFEEKIQKQKDIAQTIISVQEKERTAIGHELHDNVNQILMTAKLYLSMLQIDDPEKKELKDKSVEFIMESIEEIRILSKRLVIPQLKKGGLVQSIQSFLDDIQKTTSLKIDFVYEEAVEEMLEIKKITFFRIAQEQLKNIIKHSKASHVGIHLLASDKQNFIMEIKDNGVGFDTSLTRQGIGLSNIFERVKFYEGDVSIRSSVGTGCEMTITIPKRKELIDAS